MDMPKVMYVCDECADNNPEVCGRFDREDIRRTPNGKWVCDNCYDEMDTADLGLVPGDDGEWPDKPAWSSLPIAPEMKTKAAA